MRQATPWNDRSAVHREVGFEHPVLERHAVRTHEHACAGEADGGAPGELGLGALDTAPLPRVQLEGVDRLHQRQRSAVAARSASAVRPVGLTPPAAGSVRGSSPVKPVYATSAARYVPRRLGWNASGP